MNTLRPTGYLVVLCALIALAGCGEEQPQCSSPNAFATIRPMIENVKHFTEAFVTPTSGVTVGLDITNVVTTEKDSKKVSCKAEYVVSLTRESGAVNKMEPPGLLSYTVERTDEGKLYMTVFVH